MRAYEETFLLAGGREMELWLLGLLLLLLLLLVVRGDA